jgi:deoxyinosine 3'endonuclease (endonuclease V)
MKTRHTRIYSKTATHVTRKTTIALAKKFKELEAKFVKQVNQRLNKKPLDRKMNKLGNNLRSYKDQCFKIIKKDELDSADQALMIELEIYH